MSFQRRLIAAIACLILLISLSPFDVKAEGLQIIPDIGKISYSFALSDEEYAHVYYKTAAESGNFVLHNKDGVFSGEIALPYSGAGGDVRFTVKHLDDFKAHEAKAVLPAAPDYAVPTGVSNGKVTDFLLAETTDGFSYSFSAPNAAYLKLSYSNRQQSGVFFVYPDENGRFSGSLSLPITYARTLTTVKILTGSDIVLTQGQVRKGYQAPDAPARQPGRLSGVTVCIDPGHQENGRGVIEPIGPGLSGNSKGGTGMAQGRYTLRKESIVVLEIAMKLRDELLRQGATVVLTRDREDIFHTNLERCAIAEEGNADIMLRLHCDLRDNLKQRGINIYAPFHSTYAQAVADKTTYRHIGTLLLNAMKRSVGHELSDKTGYLILSDQFIGNNWAKMPCFLIEMGMMSNAYEDYQMSHPHYQQLLAEGMAQGVYEIAVYRGLITEE